MTGLLHRHPHATAPPTPPVVPLMLTVAELT